MRVCATLWLTSLIFWQMSYATSAEETITSQKMSDGMYVRLVKTVEPVRVHIAKNGTVTIAETRPSTQKEETATSLAAPATNETDWVKVTYQVVRAKEPAGVGAIMWSNHGFEERANLDLPVGKALPRLDVLDVRADGDVVYVLYFNRTLSTSMNLCALGLDSKGEPKILWDTKVLDRSLHPYFKGYIIPWEGGAYCFFDKEGIYRVTTAGSERLNLEKIKNAE